MSVLIGFMARLLLFLVICLSWCQVHSECPNACNGHGYCGRYDMCVCYRDWMGGDCSQRVCQFATAHVDIPKGDLDGTELISTPDETLLYGSQLYPRGTTEQYPNMIDSAGSVLTNTAHEYVECAGKGYCDRINAVCECVEGYEGSACQRTSCPYNEDTGTCSSHGQCLSAREIAALDYNNEYKLWDADITHGCHCEAGYHGASCEKRKCKMGVDPLFQDPEGSYRYANYSVVIYTEDKNAIIFGNYSLIFTDVNNEDWRTKPISYDASCYKVIEALEELPNNVIPWGSVLCQKWEDYRYIPIEDEPYLDNSATHALFGIKYTLAFPGNPGIIKPLQIHAHLDGKRPTLWSDEHQSTLGWYIYPNGFQGHTTEYFTSKCKGVDVTLEINAQTAINSEYHYLGGMSSLETRLLQKCLGDVDGFTGVSDATGRIEGSTYSWDYGTVFNPHLIRLVDRTDVSSTIVDMCNRTTDEEIFAGTHNGTDVSNYYSDGGRSSYRGRTCTHSGIHPGFLVAMYYDPIIDRYRLMTRPGRDYSRTTTFAVWTTEGTAQMVSDEARVYTSPHTAQYYSNVVYTTNATSNYTATRYLGNIECETNKEGQHGAMSCLEKEDYVFFLDKARPDRNPKYMNMYQVKKLYIDPSTTNNTNHRNWEEGNERNRIVLDAGINAYYHDVNNTMETRAYIFFPPENGGYEFMSECSNRGICNEEEGLCECFDSYDGDSCNKVNNFMTYEINE